MVFHCCLFTGSHLFYTNILRLQPKILVKVHRVFPSNCKKSVSSRTFQVHQAHVRDSGEVVTPFMQVGTYPTRNFATFGPSELQPPFTGDYFQSRSLSILPFSTGQVSVPIHLFSNLQRLVFLLNSRFSFFSVNIIKFLLLCYSFSRSYRANLPSSFNMVILNAFVCYTNLPESV